jgi:cholesterol transport system auxiliary component
MTRRLVWLLCIAYLGVELCGCALLSKSEPLVPRYFTPELGDERSTDTRGRSATPAVEYERRPLRIGRIGASSQLRERIVYRSSAEESGFYETARWTERPENYLRRALSRSLFEQRGFSRVASGSAPTLEAELVAFEEVRGTPDRARVQIVVTLADDRITRLEQTITIEHDVPTASREAHTAAVVRTLGAALREAVERIADQVASALPPATRAAPVGVSTLSTQVR